MKNLKNIFIILLMTFSFLFPSLVFAEDSQDEIYVISGYNETDIIVDSSGNVVPGMAYCLDSKENPPSSDVSYKRAPLSDFSNYSKNHQDQVFTPRVKERLIKIMVDPDSIKTFVKSLDSDKFVNWIVQNRSNLSGVYCSNDLSDSECREILNREWDSFEKVIIQQMIWFLVHDNDDWNTFSLDDGSSSGHFSSYWNRQHYFYKSDNPIEDPHSLWNFVYIPVANYIDNDMPNYYRMGYDAWVYYTDSKLNQNVISSYFRIDSSKKILISKIDDKTGKFVSGAKLILRDSSKNIVYEWISSDEPHELFLQNGDYTVEESEAPNGYELLAEKVSFSVNDDSDNLEISIRNKPIPRKNEIFKNPETGDLIVRIFLTILFCCGLYFIVLKVKKSIKS